MDWNVGRSAGRHGHKTGGYYWVASFIQREKFHPGPTNHLFLGEDIIKKSLERLSLVKLAKIISSKNFHPGQARPAQE